MAAVSQTPEKPNWHGCGANTSTRSSRMSRQPLELFVSNVCILKTQELVAFLYVQYSKAALTKFLTHFKEVFKDWHGFDEPDSGEMHPLSTSCHGVACRFALITAAEPCTCKMMQNQTNVLHPTANLSLLPHLACIAHMLLGPRLSDLVLQHLHSMHTSIEPHVVDSGPILRFCSLYGPPKQHHTALISIHW